MACVHRHIEDYGVFRLRCLACGEILDKDIDGSPSEIPEDGFVEEEALQSVSLSLEPER